MRRKKNMISLCMAAVLAVLCVGCSKGDMIRVPQIVVKQVLKVDGNVCSLPQAKVYLANYQNLYGTVAGVDLWKRDSQEEPLAEYVKDLTLFQLTKILSMDSLAKSRKIELEETELASIQEAAEAYFKSLNEQELEYMEVDQSDIQKLYEDYALAQKVYKSLTADINSEVSDDEARVMDAMQIVVESKSGAKEVKKALADGADFATLAGSYNSAEDVKIQFGRGELPQKVEKAAFALDNGEVSKCIKTSEGYYFVYCVKKFNQELTDSHKLEIVRQREKEAFGDVYDAYSRTISKTLYQKTWDAVEVDHSEEITTDSFFSVYQEYCGELF